VNDGSNHIENGYENYNVDPTFGNDPQSAKLLTCISLTVAHKVGGPEIVHLGAETEFWGGEAS